MAAGIVSAMISVGLAKADFFDLEGILLFFFKCLTVGTLVGSFLLILCGRKFAAIGPDYSPEDVASGQYFVSCLLLYASSCMLGTCGALSLVFTAGVSSVTGAAGIADVFAAVPDYMRYTMILAIAGLLGTIFIRSTMRNPDVIDAMMWDEEQVHKATSIWRILIALFLPLIILLIILLIVGYIALTAAADSMDTWTCHHCQAINSGGNRCYNCNRRRGSLW
ncbi:MAG: hypothetical protein IKQ60_00100 [Candidatus Methanomethylophilaceae archaeon]|nr:hypothetical protein [Candidatus Methanomethylophilaceae archaeon]